jgi:hypothetical protein
MAFYPVTRLKLEQFFQQGKIAGFKFRHQAAGAAGQHMGMGPMPGNKAMFSVFFMHPVQATQLLQGFDRPVHGGGADSFIFQYTGGVLDGIAMGCVAEQLPDGRSLVGETVAQFMKTSLEIMGCICIF